MLYKCGAGHLLLVQRPQLTVVYPIPTPAPCSIHRLGQYKPITVVRLIIAGTIEERILKLQVGVASGVAWGGTRRGVGLGREGKCWMAGGGPMQSSACGVGKGRQAGRAGWGAILVYAAAQHGAPSSSRLEWSGVAWGGTWRGVG